MVINRRLCACRICLVVLPGAIPSLLHACIRKRGGGSRIGVIALHINRVSFERHPLASFDTSRCQALFQDFKISIFQYFNISRFHDTLRPWKFLILFSNIALLLPQNGGWPQRSSCAMHPTLHISISFP